MNEQKIDPDQDYALRKLKPDDFFGLTLLKFSRDQQLEP